MSEVERVAGEIRDGTHSPMRVALICASVGVASISFCTAWLKCAELIS
jgi:hypothetical protein